MTEVSGGPSSEDFSDTGLINRLLRLVDRTSSSRPLIYVPEHSRFYFWEPWEVESGGGAGVWVRDDKNDSAAYAATLWVAQELAWLMPTLSKELQDDARELRKRSLIWAKRKMMVEGLKRDTQIIIHANRLDADPHRLTTPTGTLILPTGRLELSTPATHLSVRSTNVEYDPTATSEALDRYFALFLPDPDEQLYVFRLLGTALIGGNHDKVLIVILGPRHSGKSTLVELLHKTLGNYVAPASMSVFRGNFDDRPRPDIIAVLDRRIITMVETSEELVLHADQLKRITGGGDELSVRAMRSDTMIERAPAFTAIIVGNTVFRVRGADAAAKARLRVVPLDQTIGPAEDDPQARAELVNDPDVQRAFLNRLIIGCRSCSGSTAHIEMPQRFALATMETFASLDHVADGIEALKDAGVLVASPGTPVYECIRTSRLHALYVEWVRRYGTRTDRADQLGPKQFTQRVADLGYSVRHSNGSRLQGWIEASTMEALQWQAGM